MSVAIPALQGRGMTMSDQARPARPEDARTSSALRFEGAGRTYAELDERVDPAGAGAAHRGVGAGDRVAVLALNGDGGAGDATSRACGSARSSSP